MYIKRSILLILGLTLLLVVVPMTQASSPPSILTGNFETTDRDNITRKINGDGSVILSYTGTSEFTGPVSGIKVSSVKLVLHPDGTFTINSRGLFTGSIEGAEGTMLSNHSFRGSGTLPNTIGGGNLNFYQGTGDLKGVVLRGETSSGTYSLMLHSQ